MIPSATLEIHNKTNKTFEISVQESDYFLLLTILKIIQ